MKWEFPRGEGSGGGKYEENAADHIIPACYAGYIGISLRVLILVLILVLVNWTLPYASFPQPPPRALASCPRARDEASDWKQLMLEASWDGKKGGRTSNLSPSRRLCIATEKPKYKAESTLYLRESVLIKRSLA